MAMKLNAELGKAIITVALLFAIGFVGLIFFLIFGNLSGNLGFKDSSDTIGNETAGVGAIGGYNLNVTAELILSAAANTTFQGVSNVVLYNFTLNDGTLVPASNFSVNTSAGSVILVATSPVWDNVSASYDFTFDGQAEVESENLIKNLTQGGGRFYSQFPLIFQILGIFLLVTIFIGMFALVVMVLKMFGDRKGGRKFC